MAALCLAKGLARTSVPTTSLSYTKNHVTMAALRLAKGLARTYIPTTSPDFPRFLLLKALLSSNGTAPWKRHSSRPRPRRRSATSPPPTDLLYLGSLFTSP